MTMLAKIRSVSSRGELVKLASRPMTVFECIDSRTPEVARRISRATLRPNERWNPMLHINNRYLVQLSHVETEFGIVDHLWIRHHAEVMPRAWRDLQEIKNAVLGSDRVAVEVFPAERELVDQADMAHLWGYPPGFVMPFGL